MRNPPLRCPSWSLAGWTLAWTLACTGAADSPPPAPSVEEPPAPAALPALDLDGPRDTDCPMSDPSEFEPMLAAEQPHGSAPIVARSPNAIVETVTMTDGRVVRVVRGGCAHYGETWQLAPAPPGPAAAALHAALEQLAYTSDARTILLKYLPDAPPDAHEGFACDEAWCTVSRAPGHLTALYDFAL